MTKASLPCMVGKEQPEQGIGPSRDWTQGGAQGSREGAQRTDGPQPWFWPEHVTAGPHPGLVMPP